MYGLIMAFQDFSPARGFGDSPWIGLENFRWIFSQPAFVRTIYNTLFISLFKIALRTAASVLFAILLNEIGNMFLKRFFQTVVYIPHFISWVIMAGIMQTLLASDGIVNNAIVAVGGSTVPFLANPVVFPWTMMLCIWQR
jgi:putative aldouronate transport system permease protein